MVMLGCGHVESPANTPAPAATGGAPPADAGAAPAVAPVVWATFTPSVFARFCWWDPAEGAPTPEEAPAR